MLRAHEESATKSKRVRAAWDRKRRDAATSSQGSGARPWLADHGLLVPGAEPSPLAENIEVQASHIGLGVNPLALYALADRLAQPEGEWAPFEPKGARRWFYKPGA